MTFKKFKNTLYAAVMTLALGITAFAGVDANAATITTNPQENSKQTISVGSTISRDGITNLKINGKKVSKMKKKVKTVQTYKDTTAVINRDSRTYVIDSEFKADTEDYDTQYNENYKYITTGDYEFTFLKTGTYKISYDSYTTGETKEETSPDGISTTYTYELIKTHHVDTYKVVITTDPIKSFTLGKNKITNTYKSNGTKYNRKTVTKYRYLKGKSGKLTITTNKNYKVTSAFVVTYNEDGTVNVAASGNKQKVTYGTGKQTSTTQVAKYVYDANGDYIYEKDAAGNNTDRVKAEMVTTAISTSKYKPTTIYYGYKDTYTGSYTTYSVGTKQVYVLRRDQFGDVMYQENPDGTPVLDENGYWKKVVDTVTATTITRKYPERLIVDGAYKTVEVVEELVILPGAHSIYEGKYNYYLDAACRGDSFYTGDFELVSKDGVAPYNLVTLTDGRVRKYTNPVYNRKFYQADYVGSWQAVEGDWYDSYDFTVDPATGYTTTTTKYQWVDTYDANGKRTEIKDLNKVTTTSMDGTQTFNMK